MEKRFAVILMNKGSCKGTYMICSKKDYDNGFKDECKMMFESDSLKEAEKELNKYNKFKEFFQLLHERNDDTDYRIIKFNEFGSHYFFATRIVNGWLVDYGLTCIMPYHTTKSKTYYRLSKQSIGKLTVNCKEDVYKIMKKIKYFN